MRIRSFKVKSYRTVRDEVDLNVLGGLTLVGPNNSGKTNIVRAVELFFTGYDNVRNYSRTHDMTYGQNGTQTSITAAFDGDPDGEDADIYDILDSLYDLLGLPARDGSEFTVYLYFTDTSKPVYRIFPNTKRPTANNEKAAYSRKERQLIEAVIGQFVTHYIPSEKSFRDLYDDLLLPFLLETSFEKLKPNLEDMRNALNETAQTLNHALDRAGLGNLKAMFRFPENAQKLLGQIDFQLSDPLETSIFRKGMGVQSAALLAAFHWITEQETASGKKVIWLLEEPESYLHPELTVNCGVLIDELRKKALVITTTHSLAFVPRSPEMVAGTEYSDGTTKVAKFTNHFEATARIRKSLGVKFSDFYNLSEYNVFVEGEGDREYMSWFLDITKRFPDTVNKWPHLRGQCSFIDMGGVSQMAGFLRATFQFIQGERAAVIMLDSDEAGVKVRNELQKFFGQKQIPFQPNQHFVSIRSGFAIEGLFPDSWTMDLIEEHPEWFISHSVDAQGQLEPFRLQDDQKKGFATRMRSLAELEENLDWATRWVSVCDALEKALAWQGQRLYGPAVDVPAAPPGVPQDAVN